MTEPTAATPKRSPESFELRARPEPVTRINRKVLIGGASLVLLLIAGLVLVALRPPTFRSANPEELYTVDRKPISDGLSRLPASYEGVPRTAPESGATIPSVLDRLSRNQAPTSDPFAEAEQAERVRLARMAGQAREAPVFFRLQAKQAPSSASLASPTTTKAAVAASETAFRVLPRGTDTSDTQSVDTVEPTRKLAFLKAEPEKAIYNAHALETPASPYQLMAGTIIAASLVSGLNSDLPGFVIAQVTENVFDSLTGHSLLIPQGARLLGRYDNVVAFGQQRALVVWQRIVLPDGSSVVIDNLPATDTGGYAGLSDEIDLHTWQLLKGVALATVLGVGSSLAFGQGSGDSDIVRALRESTGQTTNRAGQRLVEKNLNVQPTLTVRPGWPLRVIVHKDIILRPYRLPAN